MCTSIDCHPRRSDVIVRVNCRMSDGLIVYSSAEIITFFHVVVAARQIIWFSIITRVIINFTFFVLRCRVPILYINCTYIVLLYNGGGQTWRLIFKKCRPYAGYRYHFPHVVFCRWNVKSLVNSFTLRVLPD